MKKFCSHSDFSIEVWSGPGDEYEILGHLDASNTVELMGRDEARQWWKIKTILGEDGFGWIEVNPKAVEAINTENIPIALAPPTPTSTNTPTSVPADTSTPTSTATSTNTATPTNTPTPFTPTPTPFTVPAGQFKLLKPTEDEPTPATSTATTTFEWLWGGSLEANQGFEIRVWQDGKEQLGVHNAVLANTVDKDKQGGIEHLGSNTYRLVADIANAPGVLNTSGVYSWTVVLVQIDPEYNDLHIQADPGRLHFVPPGPPSTPDNGGTTGPTGGW
jgi:hypothetical protein